MELKMINSKLVTVKDLENIQELDLYDLPERIYKRYKETTRGNDFISIEECKKKLIRNIILSYEAPVKVGLEYKRCFYYGCLIIQLNLEERNFCYIDNRFDKGSNFSMDLEKRKVLNYIMGLKND